VGEEKRRLRVDILRSRFPPITYIPQIKEASDFVTPDAEKCLPELSALTQMDPAVIDVVTQPKSEKQNYRIQWLW
jgi:hypothetical protein